MITYVPTKSHLFKKIFDSFLSFFFALSDLALRHRSLNKVSYVNLGDNYNPDRHAFLSLYRERGAKITNGKRKSRVGSNQDLCYRLGCALSAGDSF